MPYCPVCRGPDRVEQPDDDDRKLASLSSTPAPGTRRSALLHAYAQRCFTVAPITRSASSRNGTSVLLPYTSEVDAMKTSFFFLFACLSTTSVPCTLVSIVWTGCSTISLTPTAAAR